MKTSTILVPFVPIKEKPVLTLTFLKKQGR